MASCFKKVFMAAAVFTLLLLSGCGRSDVSLTVNGDGSFSAEVNYSITKALMGSEEVQNDVKSLITDSLDENNIEYTESENDEYVIISVKRSFADIGELTDAAAWQGISMVPKFTAEKTEGALWARYEDGRLKIDGTLDAAAFGAEELVSRGDELSTDFGGSLTVNLPKEAEAHNGDASENAASYYWGGSGNESREVSLVSAPLKAAGAPSASGGENEGEKKPFNKAAAAVVIIAAAAAVIAAVCVLIKKRRAGADAQGSPKPEEKESNE